MKIGFFDSGVGGLFALKKFMSYDVECVYFADTAHMPYGNKTYEQLLDRCTFIVYQLLKHDVSCIVIPCNTAIITLPELQKQFPLVRFVQAVDYTLEQAVSCAPKKIAVMATQAVTDSGLYAHKIEKLGYECVSIACPQLATFVEKNDELGMSADVETYSAQIALDQQIDVLILGCTHYARVKNALQKKLPTVHIVESDDHVDLVSKELQPGTARIQFIVSGDEQEFLEMVDTLL
jgi:glutamate racemase